MSNFSNNSNEFNLELWSSMLTNVFRLETTPAKIIIAILMATVCPFSVFVNLLTCYVIYYDRTMHTATNYYLFNLAVSDVILTFTILIEFGDYLILEYPQSEWMCKVQWFSVSCLWNNTMLTITALAIERYIAILYPFKVKSTLVWKRVMKNIVVLWIIAIVMSFPDLLVVTVLKYRQQTACFVIPDFVTRAMNGMLGIVTFFIPLIIVIFVYSMIIYTVNNRKKNLGHQDITGKLNKLMVAMLLSFLISWIPFFVQRLALAVLEPSQLLRLAKWWCIIIRVVCITSWFSVILNPIIFSLVSTKFRKALKTLWNVKIRRMPSTRRSRVFMEINEC